MKNKKINDSEMAKILGVTSTAVYRYKTHKRKPEARTMLKIFKLTKGLVTPNDFYNISST